MILHSLIFNLLTTNPSGEPCGWSGAWFERAGCLQWRLPFRLESLHQCRGAPPRGTPRILLLLHIPFEGEISHSSKNDKKIEIYKFIWVQEFGYKTDSVWTSRCSLVLICDKCLDVSVYYAYIKSVMDHVFCFPDFAKQWILPPWKWNYSRFERRWGLFVKYKQCIKMFQPSIVFFTRGHQMIFLWKSFGFFSQTILRCQHCIRGFTTWKKFSNKMLPPMEIEQRPLITSDSKSNIFSGLIWQVLLREPSTSVHATLDIWTWMT